MRTENGTLQFGLADASLLANGDVLIVGHGGSVLRSSDNGESFTAFNRADRTSLAGVTSGAGQGLILVGQMVFTKLMRTVTICSINNKTGERQHDI